MSPERLGEAAAILGHPALLDSGLGGAAVKAGKSPAQRSQGVAPNRAGSSFTIDQAPAHLKVKELRVKKHDQPSPYLEFKPEFSYQTSNPEATENLSQKKK